MGESQSRSVMLHHQDQHVNSAYRGGNRNKDSNFNFLPGGNHESFAETRRGADENRNQGRPRNLTLGRDPHASPTSSFQQNPGLMSPRSRLPCWSPLEPLPEIETGDDGYGRVPPDGAEEWRVEDEGGMMTMFDERKVRQRKEEGTDDLDDEWGDTASESEFSSRSGGSVSSLNMENGGEAALLGGLDRVGVGEPKPGRPEAGPTRTSRGAAVRKRSFGHKSLTQSGLGDLQEERHHDDNQSSDSDRELPELMDAVWTLRDRERFKAQEMEKHQVQLTMYRRLALIRWVRTLQGRVQEQQNRLQSSFDVILTHRKELLRMGAATSVATVGQS
ncbi:UPF0500 protein C1orf216 homolog isoform X1 [Cyprinodon tularosa]|uniref:UPF0500 protein C1orf216 homolog isoform X1 n=2 Tax=Cyprinodon tularosa TaxID=77115 RepID=UPI0018E26823|nr:UPF0500 protein C1orf216 homolog isoform X1 [Cyprinodon tularosa]